MDEYILIILIRLIKGVPSQFSDEPLTEDERVVENVQVALLGDEGARLLGLHLGLEEVLQQIAGLLARVFERVATIARHQSLAILLEAVRASRLDQLDDRTHELPLLECILY